VNGVTSLTSDGRATFSNFKGPTTQLRSLYTSRNDHCVHDPHACMYVWSWACPQNDRRPAPRAGIYWERRSLFCEHICVPLFTPQPLLFTHLCTFVAFAHTLMCSMSSLADSPTRSRRSRSDSAASDARPSPLPPPGPGEIVVITTYTDFSVLAHGPKGTEAKYVRGRRDARREPLIPHPSSPRSPFICSERAKSGPKCDETSNSVFRSRSPSPPTIPR